MPRHRRIRGYPLAVLIGLEERQAYFWNIYSQSIKPDTVLKLENTEYNFYEAIINQIRLNVKHGVKTILVASQNEKDYQRFLIHVKKHQRWLISGYELNQITLKYIERSAETFEEVVNLVEEAELKKIIMYAFSEDLRRIFSVLEKRLGTPEGIDTLLFSLNEVEKELYSDDVQLEYIIMTVNFQNNHIRRCQRLLQIAQNKEVKTIIVEDDTPIGRRLTQFGRLICMKRMI